MPRVVNSDGYVAMQHYNSNPCTVIVEGENKKSYTFVPKTNVSMAWVAPEHVDRLLTQLARMCCGKKQKKFFLASLINTNLWTHNDRHIPENANYSLEE